MKKQIKAFHFKTLFLKWTFTTQRKSSKIHKYAAYKARDDRANQGEKYGTAEEGCFFGYFLFSRPMHARYDFIISRFKSSLHQLGTTATCSISLFVIYISFHYLHQIRTLRTAKLSSMPPLHFILERAFVHDLIWLLN